MNQRVFNNLVVENSKIKRCRKRQKNNCVNNFFWFFSDNKIPYKRIQDDGNIAPSFAQVANFVQMVRDV